MRSLCAFLLLCGTAAGQVVVPRAAPPTSPPPVTPSYPAIPAIPALPLGPAPLTPQPQPPAPAPTPAAPVAPAPVVPTPAPATPPVSAPVLSPAPTTPLPVTTPAAAPVQPAPAAADTAPWPLPPFVTSCAASQQQKAALHRAAAAIASGTGHAAALNAQGYVAERYRYWDVTTSGVSGALAQACTQGLHDFGIAPTRSRWIVLAARPEAQQPEARQPATQQEVARPAAAAPAPAAARPTPAPATAAPAAPTPARTPATTVAPVSTAAASAAIPVGGRLGELLTLVNQTRQRGYNCGGIAKPPVPPLAYDTRLALAAQLHVNAMTLQGFADHVNPVTKSTPQTRAAAEGWTGEVAENLYTGGQTARETLDWWLGSSVHCANLMNAYWTHFGAGIALGDQGGEGPYWVIDFGRAAKK